MNKAHMELKNFNTYFFFLLLIGVGTVTFFIFKPFLIAILLAAILAIVFQKPFNFFLRITRNSRRISAFLTSLFGIIIFGGIFLGIIGLLVSEVSSLYQHAFNGSNISSQKYVVYLIDNVNSNRLLKSLGFDNLINNDTIAKSASQLGQGALIIFQKTYQSVANFLFLIFVTFFTLYYLLINGKEVVEKIMFLSPLRDDDEKILVKKFISMSRATINGSLIVAIVQGSIGATLFYSVGVSSAVIWGVAMMFCSLLPGPGTSLVWLPVGIVMLALGNVWQGITILAVGVSFISLVDNFLSPKLIGKDTQMHPIIVFFATLGGISMLGFLGFIIGPIVVALFLTLWDIYAVEFKSQLKKYNK